MWKFGIILGIQILIISRSCDANVLSDEIFTENGRPMGYPIDEEIADQLVNSIGDEQGQDSQYGQGGGGDVDDQAQNGKRELVKEEEQQKQAPIRKREGQAEYATFVEPHQNRQMHEKFIGYHGYDKRARMDESKKQNGDVGDTIFIAVTTVCTAAAVFGLMGAAFIWHRVHKRQKAAQDSEYPHYGVTGPAKERSGSNSPVAAMDAKLASSAQLYHYQHTKQQIIAMEQSTHEGKGQDSDDSEGEEDEGDFSVYEYPGLAPTGDIEVTNPLFENVASPLTKTDPKLGQIQPRIHQSKGGDF